MEYTIEEYFGDSWIKTDSAKAQEAAIRIAENIHEDNKKQKRKSGVRVVKSGIVIESFETEEKVEEEE